MAQRIHGHSHDDGHDHGESTHSFYEGGDYTLDPNKSFTYGTGYGGIKGSNLGMQGNPMTTNQLADVIGAIKQGTKAFEVQMLGMAQNDPEQSLPVQHFKEMRALMELSGVKPSVHGPIVGLDPAGFDRGNWGGEEHRQQTEKRMFEAVKKAYVLDPERNIPVVFHTGNASGYVKTYTPDGKTGKKIESVPIINQETNQVATIKNEYEYTLGSTKKELEGEGTLRLAEKRVKSQNDSYWDQQMKEAVLAKRYVNEAVNNTLFHSTDVDESGKRTSKLAEIRIKNEKDQQKFFEEASKKPEFLTNLRRAETLANSNEQSLNSIFSRAYEYGTKDQKEVLKKMALNWQNEMKSYQERIKKEGLNPIEALNIKSRMQDKYFQGIHDVTERKSPEIFVDADEFAFKQASKTFGNIAAEGYVKWGKKAPLIAIENTYEGLGWADAESHRKLIKKSRDVFVEKVMKEKGIDESEAKKMAEKLIGATWDVSHINIAKSKGFGDDYIVEETKKIKPYVKHVHLADNFGFNDAHLAPGMGNTPIKRILKALEKEGKLDEMRMIVESGGFGGPFRKPLHPASLSAFGSGLSYNQGWDSSFIPGTYFGGYGEINPETHHSIYGAGFSGLPTTFGGQIGGQRSRFGGTPMA